MGPSGSGKSTIASLLCRFYEPSTGAVLVDDVDYTSLPLDEYLEDVSIVRQAPAVFSGTIADNIAYGAVGLRNVTFAEIVAAARAGNAHEFILKLPEGYNTLVGNGAGRVQLSGGQRQRIAIARAVLKNASLLVRNIAGHESWGSRFSAEIASLYIIFLGLHLSMYDSVSILCFRY